MTALAERLAALDYQTVVRLCVGDDSAVGRLRGRLVTEDVLLATVSECDGDREFVIESSRGRKWLTPRVDVYERSEPNGAFRSFGTLAALESLES